MSDATSLRVLGCREGNDLNKHRGSTGKGLFTVAAMRRYDQKPALKARIDSGLADPEGLRSDHGGETP